MEKYTLVSPVDEKGKVQIRRESDGLVTQCKLSWLTPCSENKYVAASKTKAIRLDGLIWTVEG